MGGTRAASRDARTARLCADAHRWSHRVDLHLIIETDDGHRIALSGDGQAAPRPGEPVLDIFANVRLSTASKDYAWVNERQISGVGTASLATGKVRAEGFMQ
jgi:hypothetical protein